ncbi:hypothetical protein CP533_4568 [Ophiocordyceps camponoti-saundersi (nom. inval.)]|nr:hypothetical protein CP533_4568 [Ophiocordyceps camponoti-saundersi (nom. inval.)]
MKLFRAPAAALAATTLDRSLFCRSVPTAAASVRDNRLISKYRKTLIGTKELLMFEKFDPIAPDPDPALAAQGRKCFVLQPNVNPTKPETWSPVLREASELGDLSLVPTEVKIDYDMWSYLDVIRAFLPEELHDEIPVGFNTAGHVAHLNLRARYLPYKHVIAQVILDKNAPIRTVINKTDSVGTDNEFRTFSYEVLAGPDDMMVDVSTGSCVFHFDYSKVYWNTKLSNEHERIVSLFRPGEVVADVMAGIGPFAIPAGKKGVFVLANDKNPVSYRYLDEAIGRNKVAQFVQSFNQDGHDFIRNASRLVLEASRRGEYALVDPPKVRRGRPQPPLMRVPMPQTISHFVMNLPASALSFLPDFRGIYCGHEELFVPHTDKQLPLIHVHCFSVKTDGPEPLDDICRRIYDELGVRLVPGDADIRGQVSIEEVRDVAPSKRMFCASFRLPPEVAFAP